MLHQLANKTHVCSDDAVVPCLLEVAQSHDEHVTTLLQGHSLVCACQNLDVQLFSEIKSKTAYHRCDLGPSGSSRLLYNKC